MIDYLNTHAEAIILVVVFILAAVSIIVFVGAIFSRWMLKLAEEKRRSVRERLSPLVIQYISGDLDFEQFTSELHTDTDYIILLKIANELDKDLEGEEEVRLKRLLNLKPIREFFISEFDSRKPLDAARACIYFAKQSNIKDSTLKKLISNSGSKYPMLAYSSAMAVIVHGNHKDKETVIRNLLQNDGLSNQALNDVFAEYQLRSSEDRKAESELLMKLISENIYKPERTALMIRTLGELSFYDSADFLVEQFQKLPEKGYHPAIASALIDVLTMFGMEEIIDRLHLDFVNSKFMEVRESVAKALGFFVKKESVPYLKWLLNDPDFYVRFYAAKSLHAYENIDLSTLNVFNISEEDWNELVGEIHASKSLSY